MTMGVVAMYLAVLLVMSSWARPHIGQKTWRSIHYTSFLGWLSALGHGVLAGTDSGVGWVFFMYLGSAAAVAFMLTYRMLIPAPPVREPGPVVTQRT